ncbi:hypothetical protein TNCV_936901 [Trichonephila clavipes]|nr:hypothetical protein TNCV_936901 [Trichonephila clavipes]
MLWGVQVAGRNYPPTNKNTLIRALTEEWDKLPQQLLDIVVQSMELESPFSGPGWRKRKKPCPRSRKHKRRALLGTDWKRGLKKRS